MDASVKLSNGLSVPSVGFGTATLRDDACVLAVKEAVQMGYRLIDTASQYGNEVEVGEGIRQSGVPRESLFVCSKLWDDDHGYESTHRAVQATLDRLGLEYLDLYLIHWPNPRSLREIGYETHNAQSWRAMEELYREGKLRSIGVSNFQPHHLEALMKHSNIPPMINQICLHPGRTQPETVSYCREHGILLEAYCPLGAGRVLKHPVILDMAEHYGKSPAQICLRWHLQNGFIPLPRSSRVEGIRANLDIFDFCLKQEDVDVLSGLDVHIKILPDPDD